MRSPGSRASYTAHMALALLLGFWGLIAILSPSGSTFLGLVLIGLALSLNNYAKAARAAYLHNQKMTGLWHWAQGLGPGTRKGRRRPW